MNKAQTKKAANQANSKLWCISYTGYVLAKEIVSLLSLQLMQSYLNELLCMLEFYNIIMQPSWYNFSSWPHNDITFSNLHFLGLALFYSRDVFGIYSLTSLLSKTFRSLLKVTYRLYPCYETNKAMRAKKHIIQSKVLQQWHKSCDFVHSLEPGFCNYVNTACWSDFCCKIAKYE